MREIAGSAAAPAARCRKCLRWGSFILNLPLASHHSITSSARASSTASTSRPSALAVHQGAAPGQYVVAVSSRNLVRFGILNHGRLGQWADDAVDVAMVTV